MNWNPDIAKIDLSDVNEDLRQYAGQWIAVSTQHQIVSSGSSYQEVAQAVQKRTDVALFPIPALDVVLAP